MGDIIQPRRYNTVETKILEVNSKQIKITVYKGDDTDTIFMGGHTKFCIDAIVQKANTEFAKRGGNISNVYLSHIYYDINCSLDGKFKRGLDTNMIMRLFLSYIKNNYSHVKTVTFTDASVRQCDNNQYVDLAEMSYIRTGKTWYETHFDAYLDPSDQPKIRQCQLKFAEAKKNITWDLMNQYMTGPLPMEEEEMKQLFEKATTWQEFFGTLSDRITIARFCEFVAPWLHKFLIQHMGFPFSSVHYVISLSVFTPIEYTTADYKRGGRRFTEKKRRIRPRNET
jgi:hypothetical protein